MALGVIPPLCASLSSVLAGPQGCSRGRWRSGPSKWRHTATLGGRGQGAPRTCRCIETPRTRGAPVRSRRVREHHAPVGALRLLAQGVKVVRIEVREHHAPVGALRLWATSPEGVTVSGQGAPRTCRCIETHRRQLVDSNYKGQGAPRTCRCIETTISRKGSKSR